MTVERDTLRRRTWAEETVSLFPRYRQTAWRRDPEKSKKLQERQIAILARAHPALLDLVSKKEAVGMGKVFETLITGGRDPAIPHNTAENLKILERLILSSMNTDIGFLRRASLWGLAQPDILVMNYQPKSKTATITQVGEVKLSIVGQLERIMAQKAKFLSALPKFLEEVNKKLEIIAHGLLVQPLIRKIQLTADFTTFYVIPGGTWLSPEIYETSQIFKSPFSFTEIRVLTCLIEKGLESE